MSRLGFHLSKVASNHPGQAATDSERRNPSIYMVIRTFMKSNLWPLRPLVSMDQIFRFLNKVGRIAAECRHEPRERRWIMQRLSIRGNATGILSASSNSNFRQDMNSCIVALESIMFLLPKYPSKTICPLYLL